MRACRVLPVACGQAGQPGAVWNFWPVDQAARARACRARLCCGNSCRFAPLAFLICNLMSAIAQGSVRRHTRCSQHGCWRSRWAESHVAHFEGARRAARRIQTTYSRIGSGCRKCRKRQREQKRLEEAFTLRGRRGLAAPTCLLACCLDELGNSLKICACFFSDRSDASRDFGTSGFADVYVAVLPACRPCGT